MFLSLRAKRSNLSLGVPPLNPEEPKSFTHPYKRTPRPAISVIVYDLATMEAIHKKSHLKLRTVLAAWWEADGKGAYLRVRWTLEIGTSDYDGSEQLICEFWLDQF